MPQAAGWRLASIPRFLPEDDIARVIAACDGERRLRDRAIILLLVRLGMRASEVARLGFDDIDWLWLYNQPQSAPSLWFKQRVESNGGRGKKTTIVAMARKLLVALWKYVTAGVVIDGAVMKIA
jgi:integrase